jgi:hypothetical protein
MLSQYELHLCPHAYELRHTETDRERWFIPHDHCFVEAHRLHERGYLDRTWDRNDREHQYRLSDRMTLALDLRYLTDAAQNPN